MSGRKSNEKNNMEKLFEYLEEKPYVKKRSVAADLALSLNQINKLFSFLKSSKKLSEVRLYVPEGHEVKVFYDGQEIDVVR